ncbi:MAG: bifunctional hexulose-6-phosphate synthase/ribonuclease regulator [Elusimicrobia bacterium CG1_02_37_114]|nr:MAG: bifunctional hexulose-6-phosphate synthase/ribonuclease regulator [Elusimicrobia bacterium CG1_02_37_114]PIZ14158.1 MAG: bifunctional hexulose-6-phosphate synthase/ribonuclease regulator [Elusimicrobia bacterium CG_4_10_14_0_8_um_filter_37_32]
MKPILQVALDFVDLKRALKLAEESIDGGCDWLEAGTPLIKSEGLACIRQLRQKFPNIKIVADMKIMDTGRIEVETAAKAGANIVTVLGCAHNETIKECIDAAANYGAEILVDLLEVKDTAKRAKEVEIMGVHYVGLHIPVDEQMTGKISFDEVKKVRKVIKLPVAIAGGINSENAAEAVKSGAEIIIVGGAVTKSANAKRAVREIKKAITRKLKIKTELYKRVTEKDVREILSKVSTANISDALHRGAPLRGLLPIIGGIKIVGEAVTVRTYPGDWAKPVEAIDVAKEGDIIVIDAGGVEPAVWGELASHSAKQKKISGVVIYGGIRDVEEIRKMGFPAFAKLITPQAGEPRGFGEINIPINVSGMRIFPGDWIIGDDDGVIAIPKEKIVEFTNRAMDVLEKENRIREEINNGGTLGCVCELLKWEKK